MRIIGGEYRGRKLHVPKTREIRPTADRIRESLFSILESRFSEELENARVLDLFAGTGALGIEALSRGASYCCFVEKSPRSAELVRSNIRLLGLENRTSVRQIDVLRLPDIGDQQPYDLVFADPPYQKNLVEKAINQLIRGNWLKPGSVVVLEEHAAAEIMLPGYFSTVTDRKYGDTQIRIALLEPVADK